MPKPITNLWPDRRGAAQAVLFYEFVDMGDVLEIARSGVRAAYLDEVDTGVVDVLLGTAPGSVRLASFATSPVEPIALGGGA